jgi:signal transduction histidine kinase
MQEVRTVSYLLHQPIIDELGLENVLPWYVQGFSRRSGIETTLDIPEDLGRLPYDVEITLFRIVQEALTNVHRHSGSATAGIVLRLDDSTVTLEIRDQGTGMPPGIEEPSREAMAIIGVGIAGMRERVHQLHGTLSIAGTEGTTIRVVLPLTEPTPETVDGGAAAGQS